MAREIKGRKAIKRKKKSHAGKVILIILLVLVLGGGGLGAWGYSHVYKTAYETPMDPSNEDNVLVTVSDGSTTDAIADTLEESDLIRDTYSFKIMSRLKEYDGKYQAGTYLFTRAMPMKEIMGKIVDGDIATNVVTVIEGQGVEQIGSNLEASELADYDKFIKQIQKGDFDYPFIEKHKKALYRLEGYLYPETYFITPGADEHEIIDTMLYYFDANIYSEYQAAVASGNKLTKKYSLHELLTIASIIEKEAGIEEDRAKVASVIYNRLDEGMRLQMDSIVTYALSEEDKKVNLTYDDISIDSAYNMYDHDGLPPGPICSPSRSSFMAALEPADTDYLYFVLSKELDGSAAFSEDYKQFEKDKADYYKAYEKWEKEQGEGSEEEE